MVAPTHVLELPDGRLLAYDDVGDRRGPVVVFLHGTPDSRRSRHPDDGVASTLGVRLVAPDRPGLGGSSPHPGATLADVAADVVALVDHLGASDVGILAWSAGALVALEAAAALGDRVATVVAVGAVPPAACDDPAVWDGLAPDRRGFADTARALLASGATPTEIGTEVAPLLVPDPFDLDAARAHVVVSAGEAGERELASVPGAADRLAAALADVVRQGPGGVADDLARQLGPEPRLADVVAPVTIVAGELDGVAPPAAAHWLAGRLARATVEVVPGSGHHLLFPRWGELLARAAGISMDERDHC